MTNEQVQALLREGDERSRWDLLSGRDDVAEKRNLRRLAEERRRSAWKDALLRVWAPGVVLAKCHEPPNDWMPADG